MLRDGKPTINLKNFTIDLRPEGDLQTAFYRMLELGPAENRPSPGARSKLCGSRGGTGPAAAGAEGAPLRQHPGTAAE